MLKLNEKIEKINEKIENAKNAKNWYKTEPKEKYSLLKFSKTTQKVLNENGVKVEKNYYNSITEKSAYEALLTILKENNDIFVNATEEEEEAKEKKIA